MERDIFPYPRLTGQIPAETYESVTSWREQKRSVRETPSGVREPEGRNENVSATLTVRSTVREYSISVLEREIEVNLSTETCGTGLVVLVDVGVMREVWWGGREGGWYADICGVLYCTATICTVLYAVDRCLCVVVRR